MNNLELWQKHNDDYLAAALNWLRMRLQIESLPPAVSAQVTETVSQKNQGFAPTVPLKTKKFNAEELNKEGLVQAGKAMATAEATTPPPALLQLCQRFKMSRFEQQVLLLCVAMELDPRIASLCAQVHGNTHQPYPTFALALSLFDEPTWDSLSPERPLRYWRLIEINQPGAQPLTTSALRADERIVNYIKGLNYLDDRLAPLLMPLEHPETPLPPSQQKVIETITHALCQPSPPVLQLLGPDSISKQLVAQKAVQDLGLLLYRLPADLLPTQAAEIETFIRLWQRESMLLPIILYLDAHETAGPTSTEGQAQPLDRFLSRSKVVLFLSSRDVRTNLDRPTVLVDIDKPTPMEQRDLWEAALGEHAQYNGTQLASQFKLNPISIQQVAKTVLAQPPDEEEDLSKRLWSACLACSRPQLAGLAQRLDSKANWNTLVLPEEEKNLLHQIVDQVRNRHKVYQDWGFEERMNRGLGISALFAGESGTGKTMAAEVLANALQLDLYRIDLSAVVSKYIGETEKNLRKLFDAAEDGGAILFFDEADALFGKRSEVKDSHDRYANIEINYLLQRIEAFRGLAILATNMRSALDQAFVRRLRFIVTFPFPSPADRQKIWERAFPDKQLTKNINIARLARLNLTGASIHNIALNAAFLAAQKNITTVTMPLVLQAARAEFRKLDRPINEADFRWQEQELVGVPI
jgi:ATPase family associated with various cellular activities (AAA)